MLIDRVVNARLPGRAEPSSIALAGGRVVAVSATAMATGGTAAAAAALDAGGRLVAPALVDAHVHLDKAFVLAEAESNGAIEPNLPAAIEAVAALRSRLTPALVRANAERAIDRLVAQGVTAARVHVEIDPAVGLSLAYIQEALKYEVADRIALQLVAFPQRGLELQGMPEGLDAAMALGLDVVGGCPYVDRDPGRHLDLVFAAAERYRAPIDLHLDFSDDPGCSLLGLVAERTRAHGMGGKVTIGHGTTLAAMTRDAQSKALDQLAEAGIALVVLPATDLYLAGHGEPGTRSLAPWERARARGVRVAIANNNLNNPFAPFGNGSLLQAAWLAGITRRRGAAADRAALWDAITHAPAEILGLSAHGPVEGADAHLVVIDAADADEAVLQACPVLATLRAGVLTGRLQGVEVQAGTGPARG